MLPESPRPAHNGAPEWYRAQALEARAMAETFRGELRQSMLEVATWYETFAQAAERRNAKPLDRPS